MTSHLFFFPKIIINNLYHVVPQPSHDRSVSDLEVPKPADSSFAQRTTTRQSRAQIAPELAHKTIADHKGHLTLLYPKFALALTLVSQLHPLKAASPTGLPLLVLVSPSRYKGNLKERTCQPLQNTAKYIPETNSWSPHYPLHLVSAMLKQSHVFW